MSQQATYKVEIHALYKEIANMQEKSELQAALSGALSDKELQAVVDYTIENGLRPGGGLATLFDDDRCHPLFQCLQVVAVFLTVGLASGLFFSEKFFGNIEFRGDCVDLNVQL